MGTEFDEADLEDLHWLSDSGRKAVATALRPTMGEHLARYVSDKLDDRSPDWYANSPAAQGAVEGLLASSPIAIVKWFVRKQLSNEAAELREARASLWRQREAAERQRRAEEMVSEMTVERACEVEAGALAFSERIPEEVYSDPLCLDLASRVEAGSGELLSDRERRDRRDFVITLIAFCVFLLAFLGSTVASPGTADFQGMAQQDLDAAIALATAVLWHLRNRQNGSGK